MVVTSSSLAGTMPALRSFLQPTHLHAPAPAMQPAEVLGEPDGPDLVLPSGVRIRRKRIGGHVVSQAELLQAIRGVQLLPLQHQLVIARAGIPIELLPLRNLEQVAGTTEPVLGATAVAQDASGTWIPTRIRVAVRSPEANVNVANAIGEVTQHEIGHAIAVLGSQDRSEETAIRYAQRY